MEITFRNSYKPNRSGFKHITQVYIDGQHEITHSAQYYNRTWESYAYQSVMKSALYVLIKAEQERLREEHKQQTGKKRLPKDMVFTNERIELLTKKRNEL